MTDIEGSGALPSPERARREAVEPKDPWPIRRALVLTIVGGLALAVLLIAAGFLVFGLPGVENPDRLKPSELFDLLKLAFALIGGIGGAVALVVAYRKQKVHEQENYRAKRAERRAAAAEARENTKLFNERFGAASAQLGHEKAAVRLAGLYALAGLADDWKEQRQTCIDVLCAYLRMPYNPDPESESHREGEKEVRHTILRIIRDHLRDPDELNSWCGRDFDFTGAVFDGGRLDSAQFTGGTVSFTDAQFTSGDVHFKDARFAGGDVDFIGAKFAGGHVSFLGAKFAGSDVSFYDAQFTRSTVFFIGAHFTGGTVFFYDAKFAGGDVAFNRARFTGGHVSFNHAKFTDGQVAFNRAYFSGGRVSFYEAKFTGSRVHFYEAKFAGSAVDLSAASDYSTPPRFDTWDELPPGLLLPAPRKNTGDACGA